VTKAASGLPVSVQTRLNTHARVIGADPNFVLTRYVAERFLYRLSRSTYAERFVLKGALLMLAWLGETLRPTRDMDFLGYGDLSPDALSGALTTICTTPVEPDGLVFEVDSIRIESIREEDAYGGWRAALRATLGNARIPLQIDVGAGDAAIPAPSGSPTLLCWISHRLACAPIARKPASPKKFTPWWCWAMPTAACEISLTSMR
jgi:hypothetical protein